MARQIAQLMVQRMVAQIVFFMVSYIVQHTARQTTLIMVVVMESLTVRRMKAWTSSFMESSTEGETTYPMT